MASATIRRQSAVSETIEVGSPIPALRAWQPHTKGAAKQPLPLNDHYNDRKILL
jgi:hypothetical protein